MVAKPVDSYCRVANAVLTQMIADDRLDVVEADHEFCLRVYARYGGSSKETSRRINSVITACHRSNLFIYSGLRWHKDSSGRKAIGRVYRLSAEGVKVYYSLLLQANQENAHATEKGK